MRQVLEAPPGRSLRSRICEIENRRSESCHLECPQWLGMSRHGLNKDLNARRINTACLWATSDPPGVEVNSDLSSLRTSAPFSFSQVCSRDRIWPVCLLRLSLAPTFLRNIVYYLCTSTAIPFPSDSSHWTGSRKMPIWAFQSGSQQPPIPPLHQSQQPCYQHLASTLRTLSPL